MRRRRHRFLPYLIALAVLVTFIGGLVILGYWDAYMNHKAYLQNVRNLNAELEAKIPPHAKYVDGLVQKYKPAVQGDINDLGVNAGNILQGLPTVDAVASNGVQNPTARIIHIMDWPYADPMDTTGMSALDIEEADLLYQDTCLRAQLVQLEQVAALTCLAKYHGLREVWSEGLFEETMSAYQEAIEKLKKPGGDPTMLLRLGTPAKLQITGLIDKVLPLDIAKEHVAGKDQESAKVKARQKAMVANVLKGNNQFALIVLAGSHDLTTEIPAGVEYLRMAVACYNWKLPK